MQGTPALQDTLAGGPADASLKKIYADAGIELDIRHDQTDLPRVDRVRLADLHNLMTSFETVPAPAGFGKVHALVVTEDEEDPRTLGIMFDFNDNDLNSLPREGFAVFASAHRDLANSAAELLLTTAHEMAHCFNLHHADWDGQSFHDHATVESYSMADTVKWALSSASARHLKMHPINEVWPGQGGLPFGTLRTGHLDSHRSDPAESFSVLADPTARGVAGPPQKALARERGATLRGVEADDLRLVLEAPKSSYLVGEPVVLTVGLHNTGSQDRYVLPLLDPRFQFLNVEFRKKNDPSFRAFRSAVLAEARGVDPARLKTGDTLHEEIKVFFGADGWTFKEPGTYEVRADFPAGASSREALSNQKERVQSPVLELVVQDATTSTDRRATRRILGYEEGLFIYLDGASHLRRAKASLEKVVQEERGSAVAAAARLALAQSELHPVPEPGSRVVPGPNVEKAQEYLRELPTATLPTESVVRTYQKLSVEVQKRGDTGEARVLRENARRIESEEATRDRLRARRLRGVGVPR
jgi:hypothetical protein